MAVRECRLRHMTATRTRVQPCEKDSFHFCVALEIVLKEIEKC